MKIANLLAVLTLMTLTTACAPEIGSREWCDDMDKMSKGDWSFNEGKAYAENCIFRDDDDE